jgi:hypothetical protein
MAYVIDHVPGFPPSELLLSATDCGDDRWFSARLPARWLVLSCNHSPHPPAFHVARASRGFRVTTTITHKSCAPKDNRWHIRTDRMDRLMTAQVDYSWRRDKLSVREKIGVAFA